MAEAESKLSQSIDKIAYGVAAVVGLAVLALPFLMGGTAMKESEAAAEMQTLRERVKEEPKVPPTPPPLKEAVEKQWETGAASDLDPAWVVDRPPVVVRKIPKPPEENPVHTPGKVAEIACGRDPEKKVPYVIVKGGAGEGNQHIMLDKVILLRNEGGGDLAVVPDFKAAADGSFEFKDYGVQPGKMYTYALRTVAKKDPRAAAGVKQLPQAEVEKTSEPLAMREPVPHDFYLYISSFDPPKPDEPPRFLGRLSYWDYQAGKVVQAKGAQATYFAEKEKFADRFVFLRVEDTAGKVTIRDDEKNLRFEIKTAESKEPRLVDCFKTVTPGSPPEPEPAEEPKAKKKEPAKTGKDAAKGSKSKKPTSKKDSKKDTSKKETSKSKTEETKPKKGRFE